MTKDWNLSYECITSEAAKCTLREHLEEDARFALSVSIPHIDEKIQDGVPEDSENTYDDFVDDSALSADQLASALGLLETSTNKIQDESCRPEEDDEGNIILAGGLDDELTDADAEGDTDLESEPQDADSEVGSPMLDPESDGFPIDKAIINGSSEVFSQTDAPLGIENQAEW